MARKIFAAQNQLYEQLKKDIVSRIYPPNSPLVEDELAARYNVSRTPVREALRQLEKDGLVVIYPYRGTYVREITSDDVKEIFAIRQALEAVCCRQAAQLMTDDGFAVLEENRKRAWQELEQGNFEKADELSGAIHQAVIKGSCNRRIATILDQMDTQCKYIYFHAFPPGNRLQETMKEHDAILGALMQRDGERAAELMVRHLQRTEEDMLIAMKRVKYELH